MPYNSSSRARVTSKRRKLAASRARKHADSLAKAKKK